MRRSCSGRSSPSTSSSTGSRRRRPRWPWPLPVSRPAVRDHGHRGGPRGLVSVSGVKLTTARAVARRARAVLALEAPPRQAPDVETSSEGYARRFAGPVGEYFLAVQAAAVLE